nr:MAG TPA: hypothetical protein [Caudoviricetes sp.]DAT44671.1 MAG TPA: hypothetical protein [Caudoviricetes sp.]
MRFCCTTFLIDNREGPLLRFPTKFKSLWK